MAEEERKQPKPAKISRNQTVTHVAGSQIKAEHKFTLGQTDNKVFSAKFNHDDTYIAAATEAGTINIYNTKTGQMVFQNDQSARGYPFSYVRWRPTTTNKKTRNVYATVNSEGDI